MDLLKSPKVKKALEYGVSLSIGMAIMHFLHNKGYMK
jgi:hypothetical protein